MGKLNLEKQIDGIGKNKDLLLRFFVAISRFEYALKRSGYCSAYRTGGAKPNWDGFSEKCMLRSKHDIEIKKAIEYLKSNPPKEQCLEDGCLVFKDIEFNKQTREEVKLIRYIRTARNNLFHGGKYPFIHVEEPFRNTELLQACLTLLLAIGESDEGISDRFCEE